MTNRDLRNAVENAKAETREALQTVYDALNQGQKKQILKNDAVKMQLDRYGVKQSA